MKFLIKSSGFCISIAMLMIFSVFGATNAFARTAVLKESTLVPIQTKQRISSKGMRAGMEVILSVERDIKVDGLTVIESGTAVVARVSDRKGAGMAGISGWITIDVDYTTAVDGTTIPLKGSFNTKGDSEIGGTIAVGLILCPLAFLNKGKEGVIPSGAVIRTLTLSEKRIKVSNN
ncbi:MAG: hypothetical protein GKS04_03635 [Candidatus Mycalebacterium zealandia]|nr:MAG: hypothetical protein GKS04_03635 [Candidatus Mycalebacterium zealandia]